MRSIKELLKILLEQIKNRDNVKSLCFLYEDLYQEGILNFDESMLLDYYMENNTPTTWYIIIGNEFWWKPFKMKPRIKWLKKHIKKNL
jgi:hypothetical protein